MSIIKGKLEFFSERFGGKPYNNCLILAIMMVLRWMGYAVEDGDDDTIRTATGVPDRDAHGEPVGLRLGRAMRGVRKVLAGFVVPEVAHLTDFEFINQLKLIGSRGRNKAVFAVIVKNTDKLPSHYQRWVGQKYDAGHAFAVAATTHHFDANTFSSVPALVQVWLMDPMGKTTPDDNDPTPEDFEPYVGELILWSLLAPALDRDEDGKIICVRGFKNTARVED